MKILACAGSHRRNGNTAQIVDLIEEGLRQVAMHTVEPLEIETVFLGQQRISPCRGCRVCFDKGEAKCPQQDDLLAIKAKMKEADGIIIASPVYVNDVSGIVKNWIDRLAHVCHRPEFAGKCAYLVTTVGNGPTNHALETLQTALRFWGYHIVGQAGFKMGALMKPDQVTACFERETQEIAQRFFHAIHRGQFTKPSFVSLLTFKIQQRYWQRNQEDSIDYDYWNNRGWTEPHCKFYIRHDANPMKVGFARLAGTVIARFVT